MIGLIMAGGSGKRFWPLSRQKFPKQFLKITSDLSMIEMTFNRMLGKINRKDIYVVTAASQAKLVKENIPGIADENIIIEPQGMNTAPCIALSMQYLAEKYDKREIVFIGGADYEILDTQGFLDSLEPGEMSAKLGNLVTFGIKPAYPATGYGYVEGGDLAKYGLKVKNFKEKPDEETAKAFLTAGNYFWNSGMFMWTLEEIFTAYSNFLPKVFSLMKEISSIWKLKGYNADISEQYARMPKMPVDIGIMEQAENRIVIPVDYGWSDVGGWKALYEISKKDFNGNVVKGENFSLASSGNYINSGKYVAMLGVKNLVVVETDDVLLIADMDKSESVKEVVIELGKNEQRKNLT
ncbi:MAG TPA: mannose-1-phosphate guanylyltransferase [Lentisphaeria bacterium]|nr:MAG: mannose-1-phosphate guanylyltransferase [Lentisphaerae bacterium GWF2_38_69]HBM16613.1 mannose-1-phosphate guanylyltransferase [Lentisphaeria bacterium]